MKRTLKVLLAVSALAGLNACAVVPYGPRPFVTVAPPVVVGPAPVIVGPAWGGPRYRGGYGGYRGYGYGQRHWH